VGRCQPELHGIQSCCRELSPPCPVCDASRAMCCALFLNRWILNRWGMKRRAPRKNEPRPQPEPEPAEPAVISPGKYKDESAMQEPYSVPVVQRRINSLGLTETVCLRCGHLIAASKNSDVLATAERVHKCPAES